MSYIVEFQKAKIELDYPNVSQSLSTTRAKGDRAVLLAENTFYKWLRDVYNKANEDSTDYDLSNNERFAAMKKAQTYLSVIKMFEAQVENSLKQIYSEEGV